MQPKIIISLSHAYLKVPIETPRTGCGPIVALTRLRWVAYGPLQCTSSKTPLRMCTTRINSEEKYSHLNEIISSYFGIKPDTKPVLSEHDSRALDILKSTTRKTNDRYEVGLLWKENCPPFPDTYSMALQRLGGVERKMSRDPAYAQQYCEKIKDYIAKGYAYRLSPEEAQQRTAKTMYIPHFGVKNPNKPGLRLVFDAAAEVNCISLNKTLLRGPDLNKPLLAILYKFRQSA